MKQFAKHRIVQLNDFQYVVEHLVNVVGEDFPRCGSSLDWILSLIKGKDFVEENRIKTRWERYNVFYTCYKDAYERIELLKYWNDNYPKITEIDL